jgi:hypothetical protein
MLNHSNTVTDTNYLSKNDKLQIKPMENNEAKFVSQQEQFSVQYFPVSP